MAVPFACTVVFFLWIGATGSAGPVALVDYKHRDLVERRRWLDEDTYRLSLGFSQLMPGQLAVQLAATLSYFQAGFAGASVALVAFVLPALLLVLALSVLYVQLGGSWWMQALFYGIGAASIAIIALAAQRLAARTVRRDVLLWAIFLVLVVITAVTRAELGVFIVLGGVLVVVTHAPPAWLRLRGAGPSSRSCSRPPCRCYTRDGLAEARDLRLRPLPPNHLLGLLAVFHQYPSCSFFSRWCSCRRDSTRCVLP